MKIKSFLMIAALMVGYIGKPIYAAAPADSENRASLREFKKQEFRKQNFQQYPELLKFYESHKCPTEIEQAVANGSNEYLKKETDPIYRIVFAQRLKNYFRDNNISLVDVPEKCLSSDMHVIVPRVRQASLEIPQNHKSELHRVFREIAYWDKHSGNFIFDGDKVFIIDTEERSFYGPFMPEATSFRRSTKYDDPTINIEQAHKELRALLWDSKKEAERCYPFTRQEIVQGIIEDPATQVAVGTVGIMGILAGILWCKS